MVNNAGAWNFMVKAQAVLLKEHEQGDENDEEEDNEEEEEVDKLEYEAEMNEVQLKENKKFASEQLQLHQLYGVVSIKLLLQSTLTLH